MLQICLTYRCLTSPARIAKVDLTSFEEVNSLEIPGLDAAITGVIYSDHAYFGTFSTPASVAKIDLRNFTVSATVRVSSTYLRSAVVDTSSAFAYFG